MTIIPSNASNTAERENIDAEHNPFGLAGIEFIEYASAKPQALGQELEAMGFRPIARHRSREIMLYRQGDVNVIVNAHSRGAPLPEKSQIAAVALRVQDAASAYRHALDQGAWAVPVQVEVMELHIPAIHGVGNSRIYFVDRFREFSIYDVDFIRVPAVDSHPPAITGLHFFGLVQYIGSDRMNDWTEFYGTLFGFTSLAPDSSFGILPKGRILQSPCKTFYLQLIEPEPSILAMQDDEYFQRLGLGTPDVPATVAALRQRGVEFMHSKDSTQDSKGALTRPTLGNAMFELVHHVVPAPSVPPHHGHLHLRS